MELMQCELVKSICYRSIEPFIIFMNQVVVYLRVIFHVVKVFLSNHAWTDNKWGCTAAFNIKTNNLFRY